METLFVYLRVARQEGKLFDQVEISTIYENRWCVATPQEASRRVFRGEGATENFRVILN